MGFLKHQQQVSEFGVFRNDFGVCLGDQFEWFEAGYTYRVGFLPRTLKAGYLYMLIYIMIMIILVPLKLEF